jgi:hypothetical protein
VESVAGLCLAAFVEINQKHSPGMEFLAKEVEELDFTIESTYIRIYPFCVAFPSRLRFWKLQTPAAEMLPTLIPSCGGSWLVPMIWICVQAALIPEI